MLALFCHLVRIRRTANIRLAIKTFGCRKHTFFFIRNGPLICHGIGMQRFLGWENTFCITSGLRGKKLNKQAKTVLSLLPLSTSVVSTPAESGNPQAQSWWLVGYFLFVEAINCWARSYQTSVNVRRYLRIQIYIGRVDSNHQQRDRL